VPYRTDSGEAVPVGTRRWKEDILVNAEGNPVYDGFGDLQWTEVDRSLSDPFAAGVNTNVYLTGGNHPASKLYKAKLVLNRVLSQVDNVNLGFGTYLQLRSLRKKALYYRQAGGKYEFRWLVTPGMWEHQITSPFGYIDRNTGDVDPFDATTSALDIYIVDDEILLPPDITIFGTEEIRCAPIPLNFTDFPQLPKTPSVGGAIWWRVKNVMRDVTLADGTVVNAYPSEFNYDLIWYPSYPTDSTQRPHSWSYARLNMTGMLFTQMTWGQPPSPFYPVEGEDPAENNLGEDYIADTDPQELELLNFPWHGDDHLAFVHLPDPSYDDDPDIARLHREKILRYVSLERENDPTFDCMVAPNDGSTDCEFCPNGKDGPAYRQFTCMPFTDSVACGGITPLGHTLWNAYNYYLSYFDQDLQSQADCRDNYILLFTDGRDNAFDNSLADQEDPVKAAKALRNLTWHKGQAGERVIPVLTYVVGFGLDDESKALCDDIAEAGGTGQAYLAKDMDELVKVLKDLLTGMTGGNYTRSDPVVDYYWDETAKEYQSVVYTGSFQIPGWKGHFNRYRLEQDWVQMKWNENWYVADSAWYDDEPTGEPGGLLEGDAGARLNEQSSRTIYTMDSSGGRLAFKSGTISSLEGAGLAAGDFADTAALVDFILKGHYGDDDWKLGDIYRSTAVVVRQPKNEDLATDEMVKNREHAVMVGANDGMVHAFNDEDGTELWVYIPRCVLGKLHRLKEGHEFLVDLDLKAVDVELNGAWSTVLVGGLRQGGNHYFALDITNTTDSYPEPLWEVTHAAMGQTWSAPAFGRLHDGKHAAFVGGGFDPADGIGNSFYIIDLATGSFVRTYTDIGDADEDFCRRPKAVDLNKDGYVERVYFVSSKGKLYRIDLESAVGNVKLVFDPGNYSYLATETKDGEEVSLTRILPENASLPTEITTMRRPVYYEPAVDRMRYYPYHYMIYYGTGDEQAILQETTQDYFFALEDLEEEGVRCDWVRKLDLGEKCLSRPSLFNDAVYFSTFQPYDICGGGYGYIYGITTSTRTRWGGDAALAYDLEDNPLSPRQVRVGGPTSRLKGLVSSPQVTNGGIIFTCSQGSADGKPGVPPDRLIIEGISDIVHFWQEIM